MERVQDSFVSGATAEWKAGRIPGISVKLLRRDTESGASSSLVRFAPGTTFPAHDHPAGEEVYVVDGEVRIGSHLMKTGDYLYTPPGGPTQGWRRGLGMAPKARARRLASMVMRRSPG